MAKQKGALKIQGSIGDINFYKSQDGFLVREKTDISSKVKTDPAFQRTRENGAEFGRAGKAGKLLRDAFRLQIQQASDGRMISRLQKEMVKVVKADTTSIRGQRNVPDGKLDLLQGFEFNLYSNLSSTFFVQYVPSIDRASGQLSVTIPAFDPKVLVAAPSGATHFKLFSAGASIDFENGSYESAQSESGYTPVDGTVVAPVNLQNALAANSTKPLFLMLGIAFYQLVNGTNYTLKNGAFNSLALIAVAGT